MGRVDGKVVLITGAASGLGRADAEHLAAEGARLVLTDVNAEAGEELAETLRGQGNEAIFLHQDVGDEARWDEVIKATDEHYGRLDGLVNNAGVVVIAMPEDTTLEQFRFINKVMSEGVFLGCKAALPLMRKSGGGSIVNMSSVASHLGYPVFFAYSAAKGAVRAMTKSLAVTCQMMKDNIRVNSVHAGAIDTQMVRTANEALGIEPDPEDPVGIGEPSDVAHMVVYLISDESKFVNGAELLIDNALTVQ
ncbi:MAG: SDR family oxidoreductase [Woeseiaceae bacterium]|nr:SDR family oxidoreductase [Woeseiaceae bacterium]